MMPVVPPDHALRLRAPAVGPVLEDTSGSRRTESDRGALGRTPSAPRPAGWQVRQHAVAITARGRERARVQVVAEPYDQRAPRMVKMRAVTTAGTVRSQPGAPPEIQELPAS